MRVITGGHPYDDAALLSRLETILNEASLHKLQTSQDQPQGVSYAEFWTFLSKKFEADSEFCARDEWEEFSSYTRRAFSTQELRQFIADFKRLQGRVKGVLDSEAQRRLKQCLPKKLAERVERERTRKLKEKRIVLVKGLFPMDPPMVRQFVQASTGIPPVCQEN